MNVRVLPMLLLMTWPLLALSQKNIKIFKITIPDKKLPISFYHNISLLDSREKQAGLGMAQTGLLNRPAIIEPYVPMEQYVKDIVDALIPADAGDDRLLLQLRHFEFTEKSGFSSEHGYFYFTANLYKDSMDQYSLVSSIDTIVDVKAMDVTEKILHKGGDMLVNFMGTGLSAMPQQPLRVFSREQLIHLDDIEKANIPLYASAHLKDGIYNDFTSFKNQLPDEPTEDAKIDGNEIETVFVKDKKGKKRKVNRAAIYAFVWQGLPYIATRYGYYPLNKKDNDFFFIGKVEALSKGNEIATATMFFGLVGYAVASLRSSEVISMKLDYQSGAFIPDQSEITVDQIP